MKKMMFGVAALIVIGITGMTGLLNAAFHMDDISDQEYRISLKKAAAIVKNETKEHNISAIHFAVEKDLDNPTNASSDEGSSQLLREKSKSERVDTSSQR